MKSWQRYFTTMQEVVENVLNTQEDNMAKAAKILASTTKNEGIIHLFGSGHSSLIAEDVFWRAATLAGTGEQGPWSRPAAFTYKPEPGPADLGKTALSIDHERLALTLPPPPEGMRYEALLAVDKGMQPVLAQAQSDEGTFEFASPGTGPFYLGVRLIDTSDDTPKPLSVQKIEIPADRRLWLLLLLPLALLL